MIVWIVILACGFWAAAWNHDLVAKAWRIASNEVNDLLRPRAPR